MSKDKFYRREFLNRENGVAFVEADRGNLKIGDCNRITTLDFYVDIDEDPYQSEQALSDVEYKIDLLHAVLSDYRRYVKNRIKKARKLKEQE